MSTIKNHVKYECDEDCKMTGCPGHELRGTLQNTSDVVIIKDGRGEHVFSGDMNKVNALLELLKKLDYHGNYFNKFLK